MTSETPLLTPQNALLVLNKALDECRRAGLRLGRGTLKNDEGIAIGLYGVRYNIERRALELMPDDNTWKKQEASNETNP